MLDKRLEAAKRGDTIYAGKACRTCGNEARYVSTNACVHCQKQQSSQYKKAARQAIREARQS